MGTLSDIAESAKEERDLFEYMRVVKQAVIASVEAVDSEAKISDTGHFNHSAYPDLILRWKGRQERPLYVRRSFDELAAGHDVERLASTAPVILSLAAPLSGDRVATRSSLGVDRQEAARVLVTDAAAVDLLGTPLDKVSSPLTGAVASQILPAGRGLLDQTSAASVLSPDAEVLSTLEEILSQDALRSVTEIATLVAAANGGSVPDFTEDTAEFTVDEVRSLLPWLLNPNAVSPSENYWNYVASRTTLKHLEAVADDLQGIDLGRLVRHGWGRWTAQRGAVRSRVQVSDEQIPDGWFMRGKLLTAEVGDASLVFATYGQALKERTSLSSATWERLEPTLRDAKLINVLLRGLVRSIRIDARSSDDVTEDTQSIQTTVEDKYYVDELTVRYGLSAENRVVRLELGSQIAFNDGSSTVRDLATALAQVAAYRNPIDLQRLA